jgi:hypothetical protein
MSPSDTISQLRAVVRLAGGVRLIARAAAIDPSNLSRCLNGGGGLSLEKVARVAAVLGRPDDRPDRSRVISLKAERPDTGVLEAVKWFFPKGGTVARAAWSAITLARLRKFLHGSLAPELYAITDGAARVVLQFPAGPLLPRGLYPTEMPKLQWWEGDATRAVLDIDDPVRWAQGVINPAEFDAAWPGGGYDPTERDVVDAIRDLGISYGEAIRRLYRG